MKPSVLLIFFASLAIAQPKGIEKSAATGYSSITPHDIKAHLSFLASDELEGRETAFRGQKVAAQYIAAMFGKLGLKPVGQNGTFFQPFELDVYKPSKESALRVTTSSGSSAFTFGKDFLTSATVETTMTAPAIFVGFTDQVLSPEEETGLAHRIVVAFSGSRLEGQDGAATRRRSFRGFRNAAAMIIISSESLDEQASLFANAIEKGSMSLKDAPRRGRGTPSLVVSSQLGATLLSGLSTSPEQLRSLAMNDSTYGPVELKNVSVSLDLKAVHEVKTSENVAGLLEGSDPALKNQYVVMTAHYDHVGVSASTGEIYNGADDDGSGTSMILELAEAFVLNPTKPKRSVLFLTVAGEEKGLLGSSYYTQNPLLPLEKTIANLNMDMIGRIDPKHEASDPYVYVIGSDKISTELDSLLRVANDQTVRLSLDYEYNDDNDPNQFYRRSDHYNFARNGVPIVFFFTGVHADYHRPTDTVEKIEFERMALIGRLIYATAWKTANIPRVLRKDGKPSAYSAGR